MAPKPSVAIVDYGSGNLRSASKAFERAARESGYDFDVNVTSNLADIGLAERIVVPGVGAFRDCRDGLKAVPGMWEAIEDGVTKAGKPFLGICVGLQLMAARGLEHGQAEGFGWFDGEVRRVEPSDPSLKIPHMGWNTLDARRSHPVLEGIPLGPAGLHAYFVHSYHLAPASEDDLVAEADHGGPVTAIMARDNMVGTQFHPEKSQALGLALIANFLKWRP